MLYDKIAKLAPREKMMLAISGLILMVAVIFLVAVMPVKRWFGDAARERVVLANRIADKQKVLAWRETVQNDRDQLEAYLRPQKGTAAEIGTELLSAIEGAATGAGVTLVNTKPREPQNRGLVDEYAVELEIEADMSNILNFLHVIYSSDRLLRVDKLVLSQKTESPVVMGTLLVSRQVMR